MQGNFYLTHVGSAERPNNSSGDSSATVTAGIASALPAIFILVAVGALIATWAMSGTLVAMVYDAFEMLLC